MRGEVEEEAADGKGKICRVFKKCVQVAITTP